MAQQRVNALITGGAVRIGRAIALDLAAHGYGVCIHANQSTDEAQQLAIDIRASGGEAHVLQADLGNLNAAKALISTAQEMTGGLDILVNNASIFEPDDIENLEEELWDAHFDLHVKAPVFMASAFAKIKHGNQRLIVNLIDQRVWRLNPTFLSYTLSKSALWTATQTMAQALGPDIRVNAIGPGPTLKNSRQNDDDLVRQTEALILKAGPALDEFGATIRYLWDAKSITGQMIALDGGQHLAWKTPDTNAKE